MVQGNRRIRILQVIETLGLGGAERILSTNMKFINKDKFENIVVSIYSDKNDCIIYEALEGIKIEKIYPRFKHDVFTIAKGISECVKKYEVDIIHTHGPMAHIYGRIIGKLLRCHVLNTIHNTPYEASVKLGMFKLFCLKVKLFFIRFVDKYTLKICDGKIIAVSEFVKQYMVKKVVVSPEKIQVLYNAIDTDYFNIAQSDAALVKRRALGIDNGDKIILNIARNVPEKGQKYAIEAVKYLISKDPKVRLIIAGTGYFRRELEEYRNLLGLKEYVIFMDPEKDIRFLLQMCDVFIFTSVIEGFGIAQAEAMAMCKPVISFKLGPMPEIVKCGVSGILTEPKNSMKLAESIHIILDNPDLASKMGIEGRHIVEEKFNIRKNVKILENIYTELLSAS